ncbi:MAG TPA: hypothetical protein VHE99_03840 [Gammaproteobacteria bacterium]|nr:hypothetical protein [Gammaproteobacteria bacterium]
MSMFKRQKLDEKKAKQSPPLFDSIEELITEWKKHKTNPVNLIFFAIEKVKNKSRDEKELLLKIAKLYLPIAAKINPYKGFDSEITMNVFFGRIEGYKSTGKFNETPIEPQPGTQNFLLEGTDHYRNLSWAIKDLEKNLAEPDKQESKCLIC